MALGDANSTRPSASTTTTPSPTRGASSVPTSSSGKGNADWATMSARRSKTSRYVRSYMLVGPFSGASETRSNAAMIRPSKRTGMFSTGTCSPRIG